jgi:hypothetical protein
MEHIGALEQGQCSSHTGQSHEHIRRNSGSSARELKDPAGRAWRRSSGDSPVGCRRVGNGGPEDERATSGATWGSDAGIGCCGEGNEGGESVAGGWTAA